MRRLPSQHARRQRLVVLVPARLTHAVRALKWSIRIATDEKDLCGWGAGPAFGQTASPAGRVCPLDSVVRLLSIATRLVFAVAFFFEPLVIGDFADRFFRCTLDSLTGR